MKKQIRKMVALLLVGTFFVLQASMPAPAQDVDQDTDMSQEASVASTYAYSYSSLGEITGNDVALRRTANLNGTIIRYLKKGHLVEVDRQHLVFEDKLYWYPCQFTDSNGNTYRGFVAKKYVSIISN